MHINLVWLSKICTNLSSSLIQCSAEVHSDYWVVGTAVKMIENSHQKMADQKLRKKMENSSEWKEG